MALIMPCLIMEMLREEPLEPSCVDKKLANRLGPFKEPTKTASNKVKILLRLGYRANTFDLALLRLAICQRRRTVKPGE